MRTSLTYGILPEWPTFFEAFIRNVKGLYRIRLNSSSSRAVDKYKLGDGDYTAQELWEAIQEIVNYIPQTPGGMEMHEQALDIVSSILSTLEIEWV